MPGNICIIVHCKFSVKEPLNNCYVPVIASAARQSHARSISDSRGKHFNWETRRSNPITLPCPRLSPARGPRGDLRQAVSTSGSYSLRITASSVLTLILLPFTPWRRSLAGVSMMTVSLIRRGIIRQSSVKRACELSDNRGSTAYL